MNESELMELRNRSAFDSKLALQRFAKDFQLFEAERVILEKLAPLIRGKRILDIGIGSGRTTRFLLEISLYYTGIDYSLRLLNAAKATFGLDTLYCCDVRDMSCFESATFDFAMFSFNGLDYVPHEGRLQALREVYRVLKPGGWFLFSSHNRAYLRRRDSACRLRMRERIQTLLSPRTALVLARRWRNRRGKVDNNEYAIRNDSGLDYLLLTYYITIEGQKAQLQGLGFSGCEAYDSDGLITDDSRSPWIHYLAQK